MVSFDSLLQKNIYTIIDGDTTYGKYKTKDDKEKTVGLPYLSGPTLCELSTTFGLPIQYDWGGSNPARWVYVENLLKHCIKSGTCSSFLEYVFSFDRFKEHLSGLDRDDMDSVYSESVKKALEGINRELEFSDCILSLKDGHFQILPLDKHLFGDRESLTGILKEHQSDTFSSVSEYEQCEIIGRGGFGEVYRYHNQCLDMDFAVKIYRPCFLTDDERKKGEKRFFREARILFSLNHKNIIRIYDAGRINGDPFIRMEYLEGETLDAYRKNNGPLDFKSAARATIQILNGLECAHKAGIIHRDLKPSNVMVGGEEKQHYCKIIDFGISAFMDSEGYTKLTQTGEHIAGGQFIDPSLQDNPQLRDVRSDIYSVGAILYFLLCGKAPVGSDIREYLTQSNPYVPEPLKDILMKSLSKNLDNRYDNCKQFADVLKPYSK